MNSEIEKTFVFTDKEMPDNWIVDEVNKYLKMSHGIEIVSDSICLVDVDSMCPVETGYWEDKKGYYMPYYNLEFFEENTIRGYVIIGNSSKGDIKEVHISFNAYYYEDELMWIPILVETFKEYQEHNPQYYYSHKEEDEEDIWEF